MAKAAWYDWALGGAKKGVEGLLGWGAEDPSVKTKELRDPLKTAVSSPLSSYLASEVGQGLPRYEGDLSADLDPEALNRYNEFIGMDPEDWFKKSITDPTVSKFKEDFLPDLREGYAGALRGSGRFGAEEGAINKLGTDLGTMGAQMVPELYQKQFDMASQRKAQKDADYKLEYNDWMKSLPQMNPALQSALQFLQGPTGVDTLAWMDPGQQGYIMDIVGMVSDVLGAFMGGGGSGVSSGKSNTSSIKS